MNGHLWWYSARAGGLVAWVLLACCTSAGIVLASRGRRRPSTMWLTTLHQNLATLAVVFVGVHVVSLVADSYVDFGPAEVLVPFASSWRPGAVAWGVVSLWLLAAVQITSIARTRMPRAVWRRIHLTSHGLFVASTLHLLAAGTDARSVAVRLFAVLGTLTVLTIALLRLTSATPAPASAGASRARAARHGGPRPTRRPDPSRPGIGRRAPGSRTTPARG